MRYWGQYHVNVTKPLSFSAYTRQLLPSLGELHANFGDAAIEHGNNEDGYNGQ